MDSLVYMLAEVFTDVMQNDDDTHEEIVDPVEEGSSVIDLDFFNLHLEA